MIAPHSIIYFWKMKKNVFIAILFFNVCHLFGQDYFFKRVDFDEQSNYPTLIFKYKNRFFSSISHFCYPQECCSIVEFNAYGDTINRVVVPDIDPGFESMIIDNDTITLTGNNDRINTHFRMAHFDLDGKKLGPTMEIFHPTKKYERSFQLTTQKIGNLFYIMGSGNDDNFDYSLLYRVHYNGRLDTLFVMAKAENQSTVWDSDIDRDGNLVTFHKLEEPFKRRDWLEVIKYNENLDTIWKYTSEDSPNHLGGIKGASVEKGVVFNTYTDGANHAKHSIRKVNSDKDTEIIYQPNKVSTTQRGFRRIKILKNGDILGMGAYQELATLPLVHSAPWIIRMSQDGDIRWQRVFFDLDPSLNESRFGLVEDVIEMENGDLFGVASIRYENTTSIVFKIDSNGCLDPNDCGILQIITNSKDIQEAQGFRIYPNPATNFVNIALEYKEGLSYILVDEVGRKITYGNLKENETSLDVSNVESGLYYILLSYKGSIVGNKKVIINK